MIGTGGNTATPSPLGPGITDERQLRTNYQNADQNFETIKTFSANDREAQGNVTTLAVGRMQGGPQVDNGTADSSYSGTRRSESPFAIHE